LTLQLLFATTKTTVKKYALRTWWGQLSSHILAVHWQWCWSPAMLTLTHTHIWKEFSILI